MTLTELEQVKQDVANGILVSKTKWTAVLDAAIASLKFKQGQTYTFPKDCTMSVDTSKAGLQILGYDQNGDFVCEKVTQ